MRALTSIPAAALSAAALAAPAAAEVTAEQVWDDMRGYLSSFGYTVEATETRAGDTLTVQDVTARVTLPEDGGTLTVEMPQLAFTERGDGTVAVIYPDAAEIRMSARPEGEEAVDATVQVAQSGMDVTVSGDDTQMTYDYAADRLGLTLSDLVVDGTPVASENLSGTFVMRGMSGQSVVTPGDLRGLDQTVTADQVSYDFSVVPPEEDGRADISGSMEGLAFTGTARIPASLNMEDLAATLEAGYAFDGRFGYTDGRTEFLVEENGETMRGTTRSDRTEFNAAMDAERLAYGISGAGTEIALQSPEIPFPVEAAMGSSGVSIAMPVGQTDDPQPFAFEISLRDFTMAEEIWAMVDPTGMLPREPADLVLDLSGEARILGALFDPEAMQGMAMSGERPAELHALDLAQLLVSAAGAQLTGEGSFTFDNTDLTTFPGMPRPEGSASFRLEGANALLDTLIEMGVLPQEQAMSARMMMGMFAVPAGDDAMESTLEVTEEGRVLANGQRIR
jgi:hypothetical protein